MSQHRRRQYAYRTRGTCDKCTSTLLACRKAAKIPCSSSPWLRGHASFRNGASVTHVGEHAFEFCTGPASCDVGVSVTHIGAYAFYGCEALASFRNGASVTHVGENAFRGCQVDAQTAAAVAQLKSV